ncbi:MAG: hypothetical protein EBS49_07965, partial [Verrucomicrobia bacterium]|nr:hypothetical protein [Verrucomicrobiota bacterium]
SGQVTTFAGSTSGNANGTGTAARFSSYLYGLTVDSSDNIYVVDNGNAIVRKISSSGVVTNVDSTSGYMGDYHRITVDASGNLYVSDTLQNSVRKFSTNGTMTQIGQGQFRSPAGLVVDRQGFLHVADAGNARILTYNSIGQLVWTRNNSRWYFPVGLALDAAGDLAYMVDAGNAQVWEIKVGNIVLAGATNNFRPASLPSSPSSLETLSAKSTPADGTNTTARFYCPLDIVMGKDGNLYVTDSYFPGGMNPSPQHLIRKVTTNGVVTTLTGGASGNTDGPLGIAKFNNPVSIGTDSSGNLLVTDRGNARVRKIGLAGSSLTPIPTLGSAVPGASGVTVSGSVNPNGFITTAQFDFGTSATNLNRSATIALSPNNGTSAQNVSALLTNLVNLTNYYYRIQASNVDGTSVTTNGTFSTKTWQTITFGALATKTYGDAAFSLSGSASSGLTLTYSSSDTNVATVSSNRVTIRKAGTTTITASQAGNSTYQEAVGVSQTLAVNKKTLTVTAANQSKTYGQTNPALTFSYSGFAT